MFNLRDWQKVAIGRLLRLKEDVDGDDSGWSEEWKVLLLDSHTRAIVSPLLTVRELRALGVTLHLSLESPRDPIPDVSAVYFVRPSAASLRSILDDTASGRYRDATLHFCSPLPRPSLEALARGCVEAGSAARVRRVTDAWQGWVALEPRLFVLPSHRPSASYAAYVSPAAATEAAIGAFTEDCTQGLLGMLATIGCVPIIVAQSGGPSAALAAALEAAIREHLAAPGLGVFGALLGSGASTTSAQPYVPGSGASALGGSSSSSSSSAGGHPPHKATPLGIGHASRPVLILLDRGCDLATPLAHSSTYRALVDDTVGPIASNRVVVREGGEGEEAAAAAAAAAGAAAGSSASSWLSSLGAAVTGSAATSKRSSGVAVALDPEADSFWRAHGSDDFPAAVEAHAGELSEVRSKEESIRRAAAAGGEEGGAAPAAAAPAAAAEGEETLGSAIDSLQPLLRRKKVLETHAQLLSAVMAAIQARALPYFSEVELPSRAPMDRAAVMALLGERGKGGLGDKGRLAVMHLLSCELGGGGGGEGSGTAGAASAAGGGGSSSSSGAQLSPMALSNLCEAEAEACLAAILSSLQEEAAAAPAAAAAGGGASGAASAPLSPRQQAALDTTRAALAWARFLRSTPGALALAPSRRGSLPGSSSAGAGAAGSSVSALLGGMARAVSRGITAATSAANRMLLGEETRLPVVRVVSAICEGKPGGAGEGLAGLVEGCTVRDPFAPPGGGRGKLYGAYLAERVAAANGAAGGSADAAGLAVAGAHFRNALVFVVGGGSYVEYGELMRYGSEGGEGRGGGGGGGGGGGSSSGAGGVGGSGSGAAHPRTIIYGATEMCSPDGFLQQLAELGQPHVRSSSGGK